MDANLLQESTRNIPESAVDAKTIDISSVDDDLNGRIARGFRVGTTAGPVKVQTANGTDVIIPGVQVAETISLAIKKVYKTGTTADGITAFF